MPPANKLNQFERARILDAANSPDFVDLPPIQIYARLLDHGVYLASISTIYRVLAEPLVALSNSRRKYLLASAIAS